MKTFIIIVSLALCSLLVSIEPTCAAPTNDAEREAEQNEMEVLKTIDGLKTLLMMHNAIETQQEDGLEKDNKILHLDDNKLVDQNVQTQLFGTLLKFGLPIIKSVFGGLSGGGLSGGGGGFGGFSRGGQYSSYPRYYVQAEGEDEPDYYAEEEGSEDSHDTEADAQRLNNLQQYNRATMMQDGDGGDIIIPVEYQRSKKRKGRSRKWRKGSKRGGHKKRRGRSRNRQRGSKGRGGFGRFFNTRNLGRVGNGLLGGIDLYTQFRNPYGQPGFGYNTQPGFGYNTQPGLGYNTQPGLGYNNQMAPGAAPPIQGYQPMQHPQQWAEEEQYPEGEDSGEEEGSKAVVETTFSGAENSRALKTILAELEKAEMERVDDYEY